MAKILLVEDDQLLREINSDVLTSEGLEVTVAVNGDEALQKIHSAEYDLILMDVILPTISGFDVIAQLKNENKLLPPVIFLTNMDEEKDKAQAHSLGGRLVLKGSLTPPDLIALVKGALPQQQ